MNSTAKLIEEHHWELYRQFAKDSLAKHITGNGYEAVITIDNSFPNYIFNTDPTLIDLEELRADIINRRLPPFVITSDNTFGGRLTSFGFRNIRAWPGMSLDLQSLIEPFQPTGLTLEIIKTNEGLKEWISIIEDAFSLHFKADLLAPLLKNPQFDLVLGSKENKPVSAALNYYSQQTVGTHMVGTIKQASRIGIGKSTFTYALKTASQKGCINAICSSTPEGLSSWNKLGFKTFNNLYIYWFLGIK